MSNRGAVLLTRPGERDRPAMPPQLNAIGLKRRQQAPRLQMLIEVRHWR